MLVELIKSIKTDWTCCLLKETNLPYFFDLNKHINIAYKKQEVFPASNKIFNAFNFFNMKETKVVILGQDPYHDINQANGLSFGINDNAKLPPSLRNIAIELKNDLNIKLVDYSLISWAKQCVLLLNTNLTVKAHEPLSHNNFGWENLVRHVLFNLLQVKPEVIFVCWGKHAREMILPLRPKYFIVSAHPSPFSAKNFFNTKPFSKINMYLNQTNQTKISW
ncbi:uracil-DNA glycosylase [Mycoplasmoides alvi]|uniref:uracil-DNA glycosylase n=1 Tax=Mycoplasmoides alvi TaxID=78580 RepID=UPI00051C4068|nr:uracil-DNA glycosylase [Mycoplasmoides alvi]